jgi:hypothetical protein
MTKTTILQFLQSNKQHGADIAPEIIYDLLK